MIHIEKINAIAELNRYKWFYEPSSSEEIRCKCPCHEDVHPSVSLNIIKNIWCCHAAHCKVSGDIITLLAYIAKCERKTIIADLLTKYEDIEEIKSINPELIEKYHSKIWSSGPFLSELYKRGLTDDDIRENRIGYNDGRITIPIYDLQKRIINIRKYLPGAPGSEKFKNVKGYNATVIYLPEQLKYPVIWICGGELKTIVTKRLLNPHNIGAICVTGGEGSWHESFTKLFKDKYVYICMDIDIGGIEAAKRIASQIWNVTKELFIVNLPLDINKYPKGDINDWVAKEKATDIDFLNLMKNCEKYNVFKYVETKEKIFKECKLIETIKPEFINKKIKSNAVISALDTVPYIIPKTIEISCLKDQNFCNECFINYKEFINGKATITINPTNPSILEMVNNNPNKLKPALLKSINAEGCKSAIINIIDYYSLIDTRLTTTLELNSDNKECIIQPAYIVTDKFLDLNVPYSFVGKPYPNTLNSQVVLLISEISEKEDSLSSFNFTEEDYKELKIFQPNEWNDDSLVKKLNNIYDDLTLNVTRIFRRKNLHLAIDLAFHSVLFFNFEGRKQNGWINCLIAGDTSQGKTEISLRLIDHYGLGVRYDCKNASEAGLLGGLQQLGTKWFVTWGVIPIHDKQLVIMEEIKGASTQILSKLTDMRSSGFAEITKIQRRKAHARTRLIMISNPRSDKVVASYSYGIEIVKELMGSLEDIRRFDYCLIISEQEINSKEIDKLLIENKILQPIYSSSSCKKLILWGWTRKEDQIKFEEGYLQLCLQLSNDLCNEFSEAIPLCDKGTMKYKLSRMAIALACRTFSTENNIDLIVKKCHLNYIYNFLKEIYSTPYAGYKDFSKAYEYSITLQNPEEVIAILRKTKFPKDFIEHLLHKATISLQDICNWCEIDKDSAQKILSLLVRKRALFREDYEYVKSSGFIKLLKDLLQVEDINNNVDEDAEF